MELEYNGVSLELLSLDRVERVGVYSPDGTDLMYVKWRIGAACVYSPGGSPTGTAVTYLSPQVVNDLENAGVKPPTVRGVDPVESFVFQRSNSSPSLYTSAGYGAAATDAELRQRLWTPRGSLVIRAIEPSTGDVIEWLRSPRRGFPTDVANGPKPLSVDIIESTGEGTTFGVYFQIETCVAPVNTYNERLVLSHRWTMSHSHDDDYYLTRTTTGEVVFNGAVLSAEGIRPDELRNQFVHPIPLGFRRKGPEITISPDGLTLEYVVQDVDTTIIFDPGDSGATQMSIVEKVMYESPWQADVAQQAGGLVRGAGNWIAGLRQKFKAAGGGF